MVLEKFDFGNFWTFGILETKNIFVFFSKSTKIVKLLILGQICFTVHVITTKILIRDQSRSDSGHPRPRISTKNTSTNKNNWISAEVCDKVLLVINWWWQNDYVGDFFRDVNDFSMSIIGYQHLQSVTNISKLSPISVTNIDSVTLFFTGPAFLLELTCRLAAIKYRSTKKNKIPSGGIITKNQGLVLAFMVFTFFCFR